jgi:hypothetical protein
MKIKNQLTKYLFIALTMVFAMSCGGTSSTEEEHEHTEGMEHDEGESHDMEEMEHEHNEGEEHEHNEGMEHGEGEMMMGEAFTWMPSTESMSMMEYKTDNIKLATSGEEDVLMFEPAGQKASCMFKNKQGNVGVTATIKFEGAAGSVKLLHHSSGKDNYEFVALEGGVMKLGRVENGEEKIFDTKEVEVPQDWFTLTVTAAGTHYKGYINDEMITHGHGDMMKPGLLGIVASGDGTISVKKVEATPLEAEH